MGVKLEFLLNRIKEISRRGFKEPDSVTPTDLDTIREGLSHTDKKIVARAYWAVGQIGIKKPNLVENFIKKAFEDLSDKNSEVRENALFAIGRSGRSKISLVNTQIDKIMQLHNDTVPKVRLAMIWACENIANTDSELFRKYIPVFEGLLNDDDEKYVRGEAPEIFRVIGKNNPGLVENSLQILREKLSDPCRVTRIHSAGAIKNIERGLNKET